MSIFGIKSNLESQLDLVHTMREKFDNIQQGIINAQENPKKRKDEEDIRDQFFARCDALCLKLKDRIAECPTTSGDDKSMTAGMLRFMTSFMQQSEFRHQQQMDLLLNTLASSANPPSRPTDVSTHRPAVSKLPQKNLPTFDGKFSKWISFRDRFMASVSEYPGITDVQKLDYLQSALKGDAAAAICNLSVTDNNFEVAWQILKTKFEKKNEIVMEHVRTFFAMPKITPSNPNAIHEITNTLLECTMALDAMLDSESRVLWGRECGSEIPTLKKFIDFLDQRCVDNKNSQQPASKPLSSSSNSRQASKPSSSAKKPASALTTSAASTTCRCCQETAHPLYKCQRCQKCQAKHNVLLHEKFSPSTGSRTDPARSAPATNPTKNSKPTKPTDSTVLTVNSGHGAPSPEIPPKVFLATAIVDILTSNGEIISCRMVLDGAAQVNIMTSKLYHQLNLPKFPTKITIQLSEC
ncbi:uncharacterized protein LOC129808582 [Phlebotomus papatasi]|uniref:uncharacterized protein LOC129808582 n=1 Tax=Phlebotomus papatasi TaxID=29031 RepID=UPI002483AB80|nr:uncharacterized protein LOC129808582 [Phlebotomus papatasi]